MPDERPLTDVSPPPPDSTSRRGFLVAGLGLLLAGCAASRQEMSLLPSPAWDLHPEPDPGPTLEAYRPPAPAAEPSALPTIGTRPRSDWATGGPVPRLMNRMTPVHYVTVHHDGMQPFFGADDRAACSRLDAIRRAHRAKQWGDIGYHFAVDRAGTVWECRSVGYQGAHVKNYNEGNIGVVALGNFEQQRPTDAQIAGLHRHVSMLLRLYRVPVTNLRTHQEWAATACPGRHLQQIMVSSRSCGRFA